MWDHFLTTANQSVLGEKLDIFLSPLLHLPPIKWGGGKDFFIQVDQKFNFVAQIISGFFKAHVKVDYHMQAQTISPESPTIYIFNSDKLTQAISCIFETSFIMKL